MADRYGRPTDPDPSMSEDEDDEAQAQPLPPSPSPRGGGGSGNSERIDSQVQKAQEELAKLRRQQEQIEKQKRELEELSRRQELLEVGRGEMGEKLTRALVILDRQTTEAQKRVEALRSTSDSFTSHLRALEGINPKAWANTDLPKELNRALSVVDHARNEFNQQKARLATDAEGTAAANADPIPSGLDHYDDGLGEADHNFMYWLKAGFAFTLPLLIVGIILGIIALSIFFSQRGG